MLSEKSLEVTPVIRLQTLLFIFNFDITRKCLLVNSAYLLPCPWHVSECVKHGIFINSHYIAYKRVVHQWLLKLLYFERNISFWRWHFSIRWKVHSENLSVGFGYILRGKETSHYHFKIYYLICLNNTIILSLICRAWSFVWFWKLFYNSRKQEKLLEKPILSFVRKKFGVWNKTRNRCSSLTKVLLYFDISSKSWVWIKFATRGSTVFGSFL